MDEKIILKYAEYFKKLRRSNNKQLGKAPHKPFLLLSIISLIKKGSPITYLPINTKKTNYETTKKPSNNHIYCI
ncbi:hypothetical protein [Polaribacter sp.]|uniref:hypothetical protein n=1 Tax=Polaribacter sp. TaxID=1920175 RepID=UPI003F6D5226